ncbi:hypothetical protein M758_6G142100 [Ceratodon purpureus]|nr:hypothetical protein M758_6G142100 [Ceratodon purpureus]
MVGFKACCGAGGGAHNTIARCGARAIVNGELVQGKSCSELRTYIHWDGIHITEAAAGPEAKTFLHGEHMTPSYNLAELCSLSYKQFH